MKRVLATFCCLVAISSIAFGQNPPSNDYKVTVDVDLVVFNVTVLDSKGRLVSGLTKDDFRVVESGQTQELQFVRPEDTPATVGLVIDNSGSMRRKRAEVTEAALAFVEASNPHDEIFVVNFNERVFMGLPPSLPFTSEAEQLRAALTTSRAEGKTALYDAVAVALKHLDKGTQQRKALVVLSDGGDNASGESEAAVLPWPSNRTPLFRRSISTIRTIKIRIPKSLRNRPRSPTGKPTASRAPINYPMCGGKLPAVSVVSTPSVIFPKTQNEMVPSVRCRSRQQAKTENR